MVTAPARLSSRGTGIIKPHSGVAVRVAMLRGRARRRVLASPRANPLVRCAVFMLAWSIAGTGYLTLNRADAAEPPAATAPQRPHPPRASELQGDWAEMAKTLEVGPVEVPPPTQRPPAAENLSWLTTPSQAGAAQAEESYPELSAAIRWLALQHLPPRYEDEKGWGKTTEVFDHLSMRFDGGKLKTKRRYRTVNHGTWTRYVIDLVNPEQALSLNIARMQPLPDGGVRCEFELQADVALFGRLSRWRHDWQTISISATADATVRMTTAIDIRLLFNPLKLPPDIYFRPRVQAAHVELVHFRLQRVSQLDGPLVKELGKGLRKELERRLDDYDQQLVEKMNRALEKQQDKFQLSMQDWSRTQFNRWLQTQPTTAQAIPTQP
jgi:hypothetical protein